MPKTHCFDSLTYLNLSGNELDDTGFGALKSLKERKSLTLDVSRNNIRDKAALLTQYHSETSRKVDLSSEATVNRFNKIEVF